MMLLIRLVAANIQEDKFKHRPSSISIKKYTYPVEINSNTLLITPTFASTK
jgi:hypothetical protein